MSEEERIARDARIVEVYHSGRLTQPEIAKIVGCSRQTGGNVIRANKLPPHNRSTFCVDTAISLREEGHSIKEIARRMGRHATAITEQFRKLDIGTSNNQSVNMLEFEVLLSHGYDDSAIVKELNLSIGRVHNIRTGEYGVYTDVAKNSIFVKWKVLDYLKSRPMCEFDEFREYMELCNIPYNAYTKIFDDVRPGDRTNVVRSAQTIDELYDKSLPVLLEMLHDGVPPRWPYVNN